MYWEKEQETLEVDLLRKQQLEYIKKIVKRVGKSEYYGKIFKNLGGFSINNWEDFKSLPFTEKQDLRDSFPYGLLVTDLTDVIRLHSSSGTTGNPTVIFHTKNDIADWTNFCARSMYMTGVRKNDVFQNMMGYGLFTGGLGFHYGAEKVGMLTIPSGPGNSKRQLWFMKKFQTSVIHILPNYALRLCSFFEPLNIDPYTDLNLRIAFLGAEPHSEVIRKKIEEIYGLRAFNSYGLSEIYGPGIAFECEEQNGMHIWEDYLYPEIIDPVTGELVPEGEEGELVLTTLRREAMPIIRYRTRDLTRFIPGPCPCGRTHRRIDRIKGRTDDMLIINGVNLFPIQVERAVMECPAVGENYLIEVKTINHMDKLFVHVEVNREAFSGTLSELKKIEKDLTNRLRSEVEVTPEVILVEGGSLPVSEGKAKRVIDNREKG
ncbi:MAG: phenylacetate--CoA ligase [Elusimicrobia bacterium]|nr:phenylacetate--CoA ligase [Elusimicrobiota bacterium]